MSKIEHFAGFRGPVSQHGSGVESRRTVCAELAAIAGMPARSTTPGRVWAPQAAAMSTVAGVPEHPTHAAAAVAATTDHHHPKDEEL